MKTYVLGAVSSVAFLVLAQAQDGQQVDQVQVQDGEVATLRIHRGGAALGQEGHHHEADHADSEGHRIAFEVDMAFSKGDDEDDEHDHGHDHDDHDHDDHGLDAGDWRELLMTKDMDEREEHFDAMLNMLSAHEDLWDDVEEWAEGSNELAWTARMLLREKGKHRVLAFGQHFPGGHSGELDLPGWIAGLQPGQFHLEHLEDLDLNLEHLEDLNLTLDLDLEDLMEELGDMGALQPGQWSFKWDPQAPQPFKLQGHSQGGRFPHAPHSPGAPKVPNKFKLRAPQAQGQQPGQSHSQSQSHSFSMNSGGGNVRVEVSEGVNGEVDTQVYEGGSIEELLEAHPELKEHLGEGDHNIFTLRGQPGSQGHQQKQRLFMGSPGNVRGMEWQPFQELEAEIERAVPGQRSPFDPANARPRLGVTVIETDQGLNIQSVSPGSLAAKLGLSESDTLFELNGRSIKTASDVAELLAASGGHVAEAKVKTAKGATKVFSMDQKKSSQDQKGRRPLFSEGTRRL